MSLLVTHTDSMPQPSSCCQEPHQHSQSLDPRELAPRDFYARASALGMSQDMARRWASAVIGRGERSSQEVTSSAQIAKRFGEFVGDLPSLRLSKQQRSPTDGFQKLLFETNDLLPIETVIIPLHKTGSVSLCISSQVGCVMGCTFCATARMKMRRNLASWEILDQVAQARKIAMAQGLRVTGAVFMGMGEPFLNFDNVITAADWMRQPLEHAISGKAITISTVGLVAEIERFTDMKLPFRLSISLGAATNEKRAKLVPVAARTPVERVMAAARRYAFARQDRVNLSYVCISGENVGEDDARALALLIGDTPVRLDLIDVNDTSGRYHPPSPQELQSFRDALAAHLKQPVARRYSGGADIAASCGALAGDAN
ncbi:MAG: radical SAM protein [Pseudomonadota bacterium]|jgi:23S rRNA (adenine2503-C2)-methyltransferase